MTLVSHAVAGVFYVATVERARRIDGERHEILGALRSEAGRRDEPLCWRGRVVERIEVADADELKTPSPQ